MISYRILQEDSSEELEAVVEGLMRIGWQISGGVAVSVTQRTNTVEEDMEGWYSLVFFQAMYIDSPSDGDERIS